MAPIQQDHYFDEGDGYLFIRPLASGKHGQAMLVRGASDGKIYNDIYTTLSNEVMYYRPHSLLSELVFHTPSLDPSIQAPNDRFKLESAIIWQFCNDGTLRDLDNIILRTDKRVPEAAVWKIFRQLFKILDHLQNLPEPVVHGGIHRGNVFLHWSNDVGDLDDFYLGDFGFAAPTLTGGRDSPPRDFPQLHAVITMLMMNSRAESYSEELNSCYGMLTETYDRREKNRCDVWPLEVFRQFLDGTRESLNGESFHWIPPYVDA